MVPVNPQIIQHPTQMQQAFNPQGIQAAAARGANIYMGGLPYAPGAGRPRNPTLNFGDAAMNPQFQQALQRKIADYAAEASRKRVASGPGNQ